MILYPCRCECGASWNNADDAIGVCPVCSSSVVFLSPPEVVADYPPYLECPDCDRVYAPLVFGALPVYHWRECAVCRVTLVDTHT